MPSYGPPESFVADVKLWRDGERKDGTTTAATTFQTGPELFVMGRGIAIRLTFTQRVENFLKFGRACDDHADVDGPQFEQQSEIVQVSVEEGVFVVPLHLKCNATSVAVDGMRRAFILLSVDFDRRLEVLFDPASSVEIVVKSTCDRPPVLTRCFDFGPQKTKFAQHIDDVGPFCAAGRAQNASGVAPLFYVVERLQVFGNEMKRRHLWPTQLKRMHDAGLFGWDLRFRTALGPQNADS